MIATWISGETFIDIHSEHRHTSIHLERAPNLSNYAVVIVVMVFSTRCTVQVEEGGNGVKRSWVILLQSNQLSLLLMQMFGLEAEGSLQCATLLWQSSGGPRICVGTCLVAVGRLIVLTCMHCRLSLSPWQVITTRCSSFHPPWQLQQRQDSAPSSFRYVQYYDKEC